MAESSVHPARQNSALRDFTSELSRGSLSVISTTRIKYHPARGSDTELVNRGAGSFRLVTLNPNPNPAAGSNPLRTGFGPGKQAKNESSDGLDGGLDPELSFGITFRTIGAGLENMGNTCYLNSVLQCLTYTEPLAAYLQSGKHKTSCRVAGFCALCAIQKHVSRALQSTGRCLSPNDLVANLKCISRNFRSWRQEDAHEYMVNLLESMHKCCLPSGVHSESPSAYEKSLVHKIFGGSLRSQVKCLVCSYGSNKFDPFLDLSLEINKADSLYKALTHFTAAELLDGGEKQYQCHRCNKKVSARKQLTVHKPPYVLSIHLKRFRAHDPGQKIDKKVNFSPTLDLGPFLSDSQGDVKYTLYGVLVHSGGSTRSGHYYCFVRTSTGLWHSLDDNKVSMVSEKRVLEQKAYMLFYVRDRNKIVPTKSPNMSLKENIKPIESRNNVALAFNQALKKPVQNGSIEVGLKPAVPPSTVDVTRKPEAAMSINKSNEKVVSDKNINISVAMSPSIKDIESASIAKVIMDSSSKENIPASNVKHSSSDLHKEPVVVSPKITVSEKQHDQTSCERSQAETVSSDPAADNSSDRKTGLDSQKSVPDAKIESVDVESVQMDASDCKTDVKLNKCKRRQVPNLSLGSSFFKMQSLALMKKKKHKRSKHKKLGSKNPTKERLVDTSHDGPSTSEEAHTKSPSPIQSQKKESNSCSKIEKTNDDSVKNVVEGESDERAVQNCKEIGGDELSQNIPIVNGGEIGISRNLKRDRTENPCMTMLSQGLEYTLVPKWDDAEIPSQNIVQSRTMESVPIGYVGDEWDEEYDRGKRKKVRQSKLEFGGVNPFQQVASRKIKSNTAKMERMRSGNQPFRI